MTGLTFACVGDAKADFLVQTYESNSRLFSVKPDAGTSTLIGFTGVGFMTDLALRSDGHLFGSTLSALYSVNPATAVATPIGQFGTTTSMVGLDFGPSAFLFGVGQADRGFYRIDPTSGAASLLFDTTFSFVGDVAYFAGDIFYGTAYGTGGTHLIQLDAGLKSTTDLGLIASGSNIPGLDFDLSGRLIAFDSNGNTYNITNFSSSGTGTLLSTLSGVPSAGATTLPAPSAVPEPSSLVISSLGAMLGVVGWWHRRRLFPKC
jgi:hypothetical protein